MIYTCGSLNLGLNLFWSLLGLILNFEKIAFLFIKKGSKFQIFYDLYRTYFEP